MINLTSKVIVFSDLHFGIHSNAPSYIDICTDTMEWIGKYAEDNGINSIIFMGDFFDSRASIDVKTLNSATESLYKLSESGLEVALILGNHDIYLRDSTSIHSLFAFNGHDGITIIDKPLIRDGIAFLPWQYGTASGENINIPSDLKYVFCHHNFPIEFFLNGNNSKKRKHSDSFISKNKYEEEFGIKNNIVETVINNNGIIFSGHIHKNTEIPIGSNGVSKIIIEGSPYETNWGFGSSECGIYEVDLSNGKYVFVHNPYNKKHVEIRTSQFENDFSKVDFCNSIIRLNVDTQESFDTISKMQSKIHSMNPFSVENTKYEFTTAEFVGKNDNLMEGNPADALSHGVVSKLDYVKNVIDTYDFSSYSYMKGDEMKSIDINRLKDLATELFENVGNK